MKNRAETLLSIIRQRLQQSKEINLTADFYFSVTEKTPFSEKSIAKLTNERQQIISLEYLLLLYESRSFIKDISLIDKQLLDDFNRNIISENLSLIDGAAGILYYFCLIDHSEKQLLVETLAQKVNQLLEDIDNLYIGKKEKEFEVLLDFESLIGVLKVLSKTEIPAIETVVLRGIKLFKDFKNPSIDFKKSDYAMFPRMLRTVGNRMENINSDWLAWAIGDLGIAILIIQAARQTQDEGLHRTAEFIGFNTILRKEEKSTLINNPFFRKGSAGLAYMYRYFYQQTQVDLFHEAYLFWIEKTLDFTEKLVNDNSFFNNYSILNGSVGVAFVLDSYINDKDFCHNFLMAD
jgi:Lanthionine synthetase C-like protein